MHLLCNVLGYVAHNAVLTPHTGAAQLDLSKLASIPAQAHEYWDCGCNSEDSIQLSGCLGGAPCDKFLTFFRVLALANRDSHVDRQAADSERVAIEGDRLQVEVLDGGRVSCFDFNRYRLQVARAGDGSRLALRSHGRELEIGRHLNEEQRLTVARQLRRELRDIR